MTSFLTLNHYIRSSVPRVRIVQVEPPGPTITAAWDPPDMGRYDGDPKWDVFDRPLRRDGQEYSGQKLHTCPFHLLFDGWAKGARGQHLSVEDRCRIVHA